jgi:hypothetical protein
LFHLILRHVHELDDKVSLGQQEVVLDRPAKYVCGQTWYFFFIEDKVLPLAVPFSYKRPIETSTLTLN